MWKDGGQKQKIQNFIYLLISHAISNSALSEISFTMFSITSFIFREPQYTKIKFLQLICLLVFKYILIWIKFLHPEHAIPNFSIFIILSTVHKDHWEKVWTFKKNFVSYLLALPLFFTSRQGHPDVKHEFGL